MLKDEDDFIFERLRMNVQRNFPREDDCSSINSNTQKSETYSNKYSLVILETEKNIEKISDFSQKIDDAELTLLFLHLQWN